MLSNKPYLVRAFYEWITDSGCTPYVAINTLVGECHVPQEFVHNGEITFNISSQAVRDLKLNNDKVEFRASFSGVVRMVSVPMNSVLSIYAEENGQGMFFDYEDGESDGAAAPTVEAPLRQKSDSLKQDKVQASHLRLVD